MNALKIISETFDTPIEDIVGESRLQRLVFIRMIAAYFMVEELKYSITKAAIELNKHHSTIIYYLKNYDRDKNTIPMFREMVKKLNK